MSTDRLAKPGVLLQVFGQGILLQGEAGIGKSALALALLDRGHALVADDRIEFERGALACLYGYGRSGFEGFMFVRGLGTLNAIELYGQSAFVARARIDLVVLLQSQEESVDYDWSLLGCSVPMWALAVDQVCDRALLLESKVRLNQLVQQGYDAEADLQSRLTPLLHEEKP